MNGLRRDGHLTDLALEHAATGAPLPATAAHLSTCDSCQARLDAALQVELPDLGELPDLQALLGANRPAQPVPSVPEPANRPWMWGVLLTVASAAAAAMIAIPTVLTEVDDGLRVKGAGLHLQVYLDQGSSSARLRDGDPISAGDRLGFRVRNRDPGYLMIVGIDAANEAYLCYPQSGGGSPAQVDSTLDPVALPEAIRMDDTPGTEQIVAILCEDRFAYDDIASALLDDTLPPGCTTDSVNLEKP